MFGSIYIMLAVLPHPPLTPTTQTHPIDHSNKDIDHNISQYNNQPNVPCEVLATNIL